MTSEERRGISQRCSTWERALAVWTAHGKIGPQPLPPFGRSRFWNDGGCSDDACPKHAKEPTS